MAVHLSSLFKNKKIHKTYWAITEGSPKSKSGKITLNIEDSIKTNYNINVLYLGANQDVILEAGNIGIDAGSAINYSENNFVDEVEKIVGKNGIDVVYDGVGTKTFKGSIETLKIRGMMVAFGNASGYVDTIDVKKDINAKGLFFTRPSIAHYTVKREELLESAKKVFDAILSNKFKVEISKNLTANQSKSSNITKNFQEGGHAKNIYNSILEREKLNGMPEEVIEKARKLFEEIDIVPPTDWTMTGSSTGYTTNVPTKDLLLENTIISYSYDDEPISPEHGGPIRLIVPHLYFWKSAKWFDKIIFMDSDKAGFWENYGYHMYGDPWKEQRYSG